MPGDEKSHFEQTPEFRVLYKILQRNGGDPTALSALIYHVNQMEAHITQTTTEIQMMKSQIAEMREIQKHPIKHALQSTVATLETMVKNMQGQLSKLKVDIVEGCKKAVTAFKQGGISALDKLASFFNVKDGLQGIRNGINKEINQCDKTLTMINTFAGEYHATGLHLRNMGRAVIGKEPLDKQKEIGKLAKAVGAPARAEKSCLLAFRKCVDNAIGSLGQLEKGAHIARNERTAAKTLKQELAEGKERVRQRDLEMPNLERVPAAKGAQI